MRLNVRKNTKRGIAFGFLYRLAATLLPFVVQTVIVRQLGIDYLGVRGLFSSILTVFNLAELGFSGVLVFSMYKPIAGDDTETLCAYLNLYKKIYRIIGFVILAFSIAALPFLPHFVKGTYPDGLNIYAVFLLYSAQTVFSYWLYAYKASLLQAYQRTDIVSLVGMVVMFLTNITQIVILYLLRNYYLFLATSVLFTVLNNLLISSIVDRMYPEIKCKGNLNGEQLKQIKKGVAGLFIGKICATTRNTFDIIFVSVFIGLAEAGIYSNYYYILVAASSFMTIITSSLLAGVGNNIVLDSVEKNRKEMMTINAVYLVLSGWIASFMMCLYQPFMTLWMGTEYLFQDQIVVLFPLYFYVQKMGDIRGVYSDAAGLFWENRWRTLAEAIANIVLNYLFIKFFGVFGIVLATILTLFFFGFLGSTYVIFQHYFKTGIKYYLISELKYLIVAVVVCGLSYFLCSLIMNESEYLLLLFRGIVCLIVPPGVYYLLLHKDQEFIEGKRWLHHAIVTGRHNG